MAFQNTTDAASNVPIKHSVITISSLSILVNLVVTVACIKKQIEKRSSFHLLLISILIAEMIIGVDVLVVVFVDVREYHQASKARQILMCMLTQKAITKASGAVLVLTLIYMSFLRASAFEAANNHTHLTLGTKKVIRFIVIVWALSLLFSYLPLVSFNTIDKRSKICKHSEINFHNFTKVSVICIFVLWLVYIIILFTNFVRAASYFCKTPRFEQSAINQQKKRILVILIGQSLSFIVTSGSITLLGFMAAIENIKTGTDIPVEVIESLFMVDPINASCLVALLQCLFDPLIIAYTMFGRMCQR